MSCWAYQTPQVDLFAVCVMIEAFTFLAASHFQVVDWWLQEPYWDLLFLLETPLCLFVVCIALEVFAFLAA